jgi:Protein of unknown function (DUF3048) N-terminal domain/Protein of unknown function (DUF3048) C-terminal domain
MTGVASKSASASKPVLVVKVENDPSVRPQSGLERADMVFEELVEGGITRFATVFQSAFPKELGPVRSVRHVDASIASPIADFFVFSGGARPTISYIRGHVGKGIYILTEGAPGMHRTNYHYAPHNLYLTPLTLLAQSHKTITPTAGFFTREGMGSVMETTAPRSAVTSAPTTPSPSTSSAASPKGLPRLTSAVRLRFSSSEQPQWAWSKSKASWVRSEFTTPSLSKSGVRISAKNVVIIRTQTADAGYRDPAGNYVPRTILTGTGSGYVLSHGLRVPIKWSKPEVHSQMTLKNLQGQTITLLPGNVWVELVPIAGGEVNFVDGKRLKPEVK